MERLIGTIRRECLDHVIVFNDASLYRHVKSFLAYYHASRRHLSLAKDRRNRDSGNRRSPGRSLPFRRLVVFTTAMSGAQPERGSPQPNFYTGTDVPILPAQRDQNSFPFANRR